jgi:prevent-host-death family protein
MELASSIRPISWIKDNAAQMLREIEETGRSYVITQKGSAKAVIMDVTEYDKLQASLAMLKLLTISSEQIKNGEVVPADQTFAELTAELEEMERQEAGTSR